MFLQRQGAAEKHYKTGRKKKRRESTKGKRKALKKPKDE